MSIVISDDVALCLVGWFVTKVTSSSGNRNLLKIGPSTLYSTAVSTGRVETAVDIRAILASFCRARRVFEQYNNYGDL